MIVVVLVFLQDWRAMLLPIIDIVVALIGTFVVMKALGFSLNNLSLFGLVLAVGIVVDDSIVVVENIERWMGMGLPARDATIKAMDEITGPVIGISLVLAAVFIPTAFIPGLTGQFFRQFAPDDRNRGLVLGHQRLDDGPGPCGGLDQAPRRRACRGEGSPSSRSRIVALLGYLGYLLLARLIPQAADRTSNEYVRWATRVGLFLPGAVAGWFLSRPINQGLGWFFGLFNRAFDIAHQRLHPGGGPGAAPQHHRPDPVRGPARPDRLRRSRLRRPASSPSRIRATCWST